MIVFDLSNLAYAAYHGGAGRPGWTDFFLSKVSAAATFAATRLDLNTSDKAFAVDHTPVRKHEIFPDYKAGRERPEIDPKEVCRELVVDQGLGRLFGVLDHEADDAIASLVTQDPMNDHMIVSADRDLWQLLALPNVVIYDPLRKTMVEMDDVHARFGTRDPRHIRLLKTLWGDSSDNIPNLAPRMQKQLMPAVLASDGTWDDFVRLVGVAHQLGALTPRCRQLLVQNHKALLRNYELVGLSTDREIVWLQDSNLSV